MANRVKIEDYALIGNFRTGALVSKEGSIDWLCLPRFDSPACFAALLGGEHNGRWLLRPKNSGQSKRAYRKDTLILETDFETAEGKVRVTDCMLTDAEVPTLVRTVKGLLGTVPMIMEFVLRFDYGSVIPWVTKSPFGELKAVAGPDTVTLRTTEDLIGRDMRTVAEFEVAEGKSIPFVMTWMPSHDAKPRLVEDPFVAIENATTVWRDWMSQCTYEGPYKEAVHRSLITLKSLIYEPTGAIVAAATTSLPEWMGSTRNWDYRYCWLRDSTFTLFALLHAGYLSEARAWKNWLERAIAGTPSQINTLYGVAGERRLTEMEIPWLKGFGNSKPVRTGNEAHLQLQLDVFGEVMDAFHTGRLSGIDEDGHSWRMQMKLIEFLESNWQTPDNGIWEVRGEKQNFTFSKVMTWVALDRAVRGVRDFGYPGPANRWEKLAEKIHAEVCKKGFDEKLGTFVQSYESPILDASLLQMALVGFLPASDPRIRNTVRAIQRELMRDGFVQRYKTEETNDGLNSKEGSFLACSLWLADNLILQGNRREATEIFERVLGVANDLGLLAEEYDAKGKQLLGNFPQAFSHIALINTALNLARPVGPVHHRCATKKSA